MSPVRFLYAKAFATQGPCVHQCRGPPSCFFNTLPTHPQVTAATAGYRLQPAPANSTPQASDQARYMREARHRRRTASGANNYLPSKITLLQPPGDDRRLQQKIALTTRRTTTSTTALTVTSTSNSHTDSIRYRSSLRNFLNSLLHPAVASRGLQFTYNSSYISYICIGAMPSTGMQGSAQSPSPNRSPFSAARI
jgi:hypothetical protein